MPRTPWTLLTLVLVVFSPALATAREGADPADAKLLQAEILEVSRGDLEGAMVIYRALLEDETASASTHARALLNLARCHRKRGELETARELLERLVSQHARDEEVLAAARSFLREIQEGRPESPHFDWIEEIVANPEIQARIFEHVMDMVDPGEAGQEARKRLKALGGIALPALESVMNTTQDASHREHLARLAVEMGRFEHLSVLYPRAPGLTGSAGYRWAREFAPVLLTLNDLDRLRFRGALAKARPRDEDDEFALALFRLYAGDHSRLVEDFAVVGGSRPLQSWSQDFFVVVPPLISHLLEDEARAQRLSAYAPEEPNPALTLLLSELSDSHPDAISRAHLSVLGRVLLGPQQLERRAISTVARSLVRRRDLDGLARISPNKIELVRKTAADREIGLTRQELADYLARVGYLEWLQPLAEHHDEAVPYFATALSRRSREYYGPDSERLKFPLPDHLANADRQGGPFRPSAALASAMTEVLQTSSDGITRSIAIEILAHAQAGAGPDVSETLLAIVADDSDLGVSILALAALTKRLIHWVSSRTETLRAIETFHHRYEGTDIGDRLRESVLAEGKNIRYPTHSIRLGHGAVDVGSHYRGVLSTLCQVTELQALDPIFVDAFVSGELTAFLSVYNAMIYSQDRVALLTARAHRIRSPEVREAAIQMLISRPRALLEVEELPREFLASVVTDRELSLEARKSVVQFLRSNYPDGLAWPDWQALVAGDDPLAPEVIWELGPHLRVREDHETLIRAALSSPAEAVRSWGIRYLPESADDFQDVLEDALRSPNPVFRRRAIERTREVGTTKALPLLYVILELSDQHVRLKAMERLTLLADARSLAPLTRLLDDDDFAVRKAALETLESIRDTLEKQRKWKERG